MNFTAINQMLMIFIVISIGPTWKGYLNKKRRLHIFIKPI